LSDFARVLILYELGGVYLDADTIPCRNLNFLLDDPIKASFGNTQFWTWQVLNFATSAPPHHPLFRKMMDLWTDMGMDIGYNGILDTTGPGFLARSIDEYLKSIGFADIPSISEQKFSESHLEEVFSGPWVELGDVRLAKSRSQGFAIVHIEFRSWLPQISQGQVAKQSPCVEDPELIFPFFDEVCGDVIVSNAVFADCGRNA